MAKSKRERRKEEQELRDKANRYKRISRKSMDIPPPKVEEKKKGKGAPYKREKFDWKHHREE
jgi:hypothetical protein